MNRILISLLISGALMSGWGNYYGKVLKEMKQVKIKRAVGGKDKLEPLFGESINFKYILQGNTFDETYTFNDEPTYIKGSGYMLVANQYKLGCIESGITNYDIYCFEPKEWYENGGHYFFNTNSNKGIYRYGESITDYLIEVDLEVSGGGINSIVNNSSNSVNETTNSTDSVIAPPTGELPLPGETPPTISTTTTINTLTKEKIDNLSEGWHLLGTGSNINDMGIFDSAKSTWSYNNGQWEQNPAEIKELQGFWVKK